MYGQGKGHRRHKTLQRNNFRALSSTLQCHIDVHASPSYDPTQKGAGHVIHRSVPAITAGGSTNAEQYEEIESMAMKAHTGFAVPAKGDITPQVLCHFSGLGYRPANQQTDQWSFQRGNKLSALWRFDIRAYETKLTVRSSIQPDGNRWVSCDWEVYTFMTLTTGGDVATLEAEGRALESVLRGRA